MTRTSRPVIRTVLGDVDAGEWGVTNVHAHLVNDLNSVSQTEIYADFVVTVEDLLPEVDECVAAGGFALVELSPRGIGRDPEFMRMVAERTGMHVIAGAGVYHQAFHPAEIATSTDDELVAAFVREVEQGLDGTTVRAGIIGEIGTNEGRITVDEERVFRAAARAALQTGVSVSTHTYLGALSHEQLDIFEDEGLPMQRVVIGHLDDMPVIDVGLARSVAERGAYVEFDGAGCDYYSEAMGVRMPTDSARLQAAAELIEMGYVRQVLLGSDICRGRHLLARGGPGLRHHPGPFTQHVETVFGANVARQLLVDNPRAMLALEHAA